MIISAKLLNWDNLEVVNDNKDEIPQFEFFVDGNAVSTSFKEKKNNKFIFIFHYWNEYLGHDLKIKQFDNEFNVDTLEAINFDGFDYHYNYFEDDLGPSYTKEETTFKLWAPLCSKVILRIANQEYEMNRGSHGVFSFTLKGDYDGYLYDYQITLIDKKIIVNDPYSKSTNTNSKKSAVINFNKLEMNMFDDCLPRLNNYVEAIIYETSVRDFTISKSTNIVNKGKYLGLIEENRTTKENNPAGLDYLKNLGISHIQLLPVIDFASVDDTKPEQYNWGYDPMHMFALEGSYSTNPEDPYSRMIEFKKLVSKFHQVGLRVNLDVVYNHVYKINNYSLNQITPNYFFRFENKKLANHSGCGNDFKSERPMARKIILDSLKFLLKTYDVDGFRFDLMGLIDLETISLAEKMIHEIKEDAMIYGEGWNMFPVSNETKEFANMDNAKKLPRVAFFNDRYRNILRGLGDKSELYENGFLLGNPSFYSGFEFAYRGATKKTIYPPLFVSYAQSLNYVECHDNSTIGDVILYSFNEEKDFERMIKLFNKTLLLSPGIPFIHAGQEIGQSKFGQSNTYNLGDKYNAFDYDLMDKRISLVHSLNNFIKTRKSIPLFNIDDAEYVNSHIDINDEHDVVDITIKSNNIYHIMINILNKPIRLNYHKYASYELYVPENIRVLNEKITLKELGMSANKCSIFKEN